MSPSGQTPSGCLLAGRPFYPDFVAELPNGHATDVARTFAPRTVPQGAGSFLPAQN